MLCYGSDLSTGLVASQGWDKFSKPKDGEKAEDALVYIKPSGGVGALGSYGDSSSAFVKDNTWHTIQVSVDMIAPSSRNPQPSTIHPPPSTPP